MEKNLFFALVILCIITHIVRAVYEILKHKKILRASKLTFIVIFTNMALLWVSWFVLCGLDPNKICLPGIMRYMGAALFGAGLYIFLAALFTIKTFETYEGGLITRGIYAKIRHPMYLGFILWLIGAPLFFCGLVSFILAIVFIVNVLFWRHLEEKELEQRFSAYKEYKKTTIF